LILYRTYHALTYQPLPELITELNLLLQNSSNKSAALAALEALDSSKQGNPAIAIPVDASPRSPRQRLYPMTFELPAEIEFITLHQRTLRALTGCLDSPDDLDRAYTEFDQLRREYLATLAGFGELLNKGKDLARLGESTSTGGLRLLAYLPTPLQLLLNKVPDHFDSLNDLMKGKEVLSNVGAVAPASSLTRFISAKDDNVKKTLIWGVLTDAHGVMWVTLRDFRPHVALLITAGRQDLAKQIAGHYMETYATGLNDFISELRRIIQASRRTLAVRRVE
jgi:hypothetical protein